LYLTLDDPQGDGTFVWSVSVSGSGALKAAPYGLSGAQPALTLRLDKTKGEVSGSYVSLVSKARRTIAGALVLSPTNSDVRAEGWVETGVLPATRSSTWRMELTPP
jgi:hypothetical protein